MSLINSNDLQRIFKKLDQNGDGFVSLDELNCLLQKIEVCINPEDLESLVGKTNLDLFDFMFFYDNIVKQNINGDQSEANDEDNSLESDLAKAFKVYDLNEDGFISSEELQIVLSRLGLSNQHSNWNGERMINKYDTNSDGVLDFEEFKKMMMLSNS